jgi:hypothetical protein
MYLSKEVKSSLKVVCTWLLSIKMFFSSSSWGGEANNRMESRIFCAPG